MKDSKERQSNDMESREMTREEYGNKTYHESINYLASRININDYITVSCWLVGFEYYTPSSDNIKLTDSKNKVIHELAKTFNIDPELVLVDMKQIIVTRLMYEDRI
jgi:hypothetical protein